MRIYWQFIEYLPLSSIHLAWNYFILERNAKFNHKSSPLFEDP